MKHLNRKIVADKYINFSKECGIDTDRKARDILHNLICYVWLASSLTTKEATKCVEKLDDALFILEKKKKDVKSNNKS